MFAIHITYFDTDINHKGYFTMEREVPDLPTLQEIIECYVTDETVQVERLTVTTIAKR